MDMWHDVLFLYLEKYKNQHIFGKLLQFPLSIYETYSIGKRKHMDTIGISLTLGWVEILELRQVEDPPTEQSQIKVLKGTICSNLHNF